MSCCGQAGCVVVLISGRVVLYTSGIIRLVECDGTGRG